MKCVATENDRNLTQPIQPGTMPAPCHTLAAFPVKEGQKKRQKHDEEIKQAKRNRPLLSRQGAYIRFLEQSRFPHPRPQSGTPPVN